MRQDVKFTGHVKNMNSITTIAQKCIYYHLTCRRYLPSILKEGLKLSDSGSPYIWLFDSLQTALKYKDKWWNVLLEVIVDQPVYPDPHIGFEGVKTWIVKNPIPSWKLRIIITNQ